jgi:hypothetical protein
VGPRCGPHGLVAATAASSEDPGTIDGALLIVDLESRSVSRLTLRGGLIGGGPSILWTQDGGLLQSTTGGGHIVGYPDGSQSAAEAIALYAGAPYWGADGSWLRVCDAAGECPAGHVERIGLDDSESAIYEGDRPDRVLAAAFGQVEGEYWLLFDHAAGSQMVLSLLDSAGLRDVSVIDRAADWAHVSPYEAAPDTSSIALFVDIGAEPAAVLVPVDGIDRPSYHEGFAVGYLESSRLVDSSFEFALPAQTMPPGGSAYQLPTVDELIEAEQDRNPGRVAIGKAARDGMKGDTEEHEYLLLPSKPGTFDIYVDCIGPSPVVAVANDSTISHPCLTAGSYGGQVTLAADEGVVITATGDTTWRVVLYEGY